MDFEQLDSALAVGAALGFLWGLATSAFGRLCGDWFSEWFRGTPWGGALDASIEARWDARRSRR